MHNPFLKYVLFIFIMACLFISIQRFFFRLHETAKDKHYDLFVFLSLSVPFVLPALFFQEWIIIFLAPQFAFFYMLVHRATLPGRCGVCGKKFYILFNWRLLRCPQCKAHVKLKKPKIFRQP